MTDVDLSTVAAEPAAQEVFAAVLAGELPAVVAAARLTGHWVPVELLATLPDAVAAAATRRTDSIDAATTAVIGLLRDGDIERARRLAELNLILATRHHLRAELPVCAWFLAAALADDPSAVARRLDLLEYAVPALQPVVDDTAKAELSRQLTDARAEAARWEPATPLSLAGLLHLGDQAFAAAGTDEARAAVHLDRAAAAYTAGARIVAAGPPEAEAHAEVMWRMANVYLSADDHAAAWVAFCFASAAGRLAGHTWSTTSLALLDLHRARTLLRVAQSDDHETIRAIIGLIDAAEPGLTAAALSADLAQAGAIRSACTEILEGTGG